MVVDAFGINSANVCLFLFCAVQIRNFWSKQCVDSPVKTEDMHKPVGLWPCHNQGGNQVRDKQTNKKQSG